MWGDELYWAAHEGKIEEAASLLAKKGVDVNYKRHNGFTPLIAAAFKGHTLVAHLLFICGADLRATDKDWFTAAQTARRQNNHKDKNREGKKMFVNPPPLGQ